MDGDLLQASVHLRLFEGRDFDIEQRKCRVRQLKAPALYQEHDRCRSERFAYAGDAKERIWFNCFTRLHVSVSESTGVDNAAIPGDGKACAGNALALLEIVH